MRVLDKRLLGRGTQLANPYRGAGRLQTLASPKELRDLRPVVWLPVLIFAAGVICIAAAVAEGEADVSLVLIFPVFTGSSGLFFLGTALIVLSFFVGFVMLAMGQMEMGRVQKELGQPAEQPVERRTRYGGVVLIGPVPIAFGSDRNIAVLMLIIGIVLAILVLGFIIALA